MENRGRRGNCYKQGLNKKTCLSTIDPIDNIPCVYCRNLHCYKLNKHNYCGRSDEFKELNMKINIDYQACLDKGKTHLSK